MGRFGGSKKTHEYTGNRGGNFTPLGNHRVRIDRCVDIQDGYRGHSAVFEFTMLKTDNPWSETNKDGAKVGSSYSQVCNVTKHGDAARGNIADLLRTGFQTILAQEGQFMKWDDVEWEEKDENDVFEEDQSFAGLELDLSVIETKIQGGENKGKPFHKHVWKAPPEVIEAAKAA